MQQLFLFAKAHQGSYDGECPFYCSYSGYNVRCNSQCRVIKSILSVCCMHACIA